MENNVLILTPESSLHSWKKTILKELQSGSNIYYIMDTETTGLYARGGKHDGYIRDRMIEIGMIVAVQRELGKEIVLLKDDNGDEIYFHEYINFLNESDAELISYQSRRYIPKEIFEITGITENVIKGLDVLPGTDQKLNKSAPMFKDIMPYLESFWLLNEGKIFYNQIHMIAHNADFDYSFINEEMQKAEYSPIESYIKKIDTRILSQQCISKDDFLIKNENNYKKYQSIQNYLIKKLQSNRWGEREQYYIDKIKYNINEKLNQLIDELSRKNSKSKKIIEYNNLLKSIKSNNIDIDMIKSIIDAQLMITDVKNYTLDHLVKYFNLKIKRDLHGALLDSQILFDVYKKILKTDKYINSVNCPNRTYNNIKKIIKLV
jgi:DNA polymerase III epsilon subunit-like protein